MTVVAHSVRAQFPLQVRQRHRLRPQPRGAAARGRRPRLRLHQRQLLRRLQEAERVHRHTGKDAFPEFG